ncbi:uncharacterized protein L969DRAFT_26404 [Mixia osmundae IAM 14324]|nr:uncharacterized protein L969DRAFT_26404 [Mixia osmundae IAM 14324]KEI36664.1 hypothetical protein L969DRAFT_26404 [Mixia osmundae IAM 14324]
MAQPSYPQATGPLLFYQSPPAPFPAAQLGRHPHMPAQTASSVSPEGRFTLPSSDQHLRQVRKAGIASTDNPLGTMALADQSSSQFEQRPSQTATFQPGSTNYAPFSIAPLVASPEETESSASYSRASSLPPPSLPFKMPRRRTQEAKERRQASSSSAASSLGSSYPFNVSEGFLATSAPTLAPALTPPVAISTDSPVPSTSRKRPGIQPASSYVSDENLFNNGPPTPSLSSATMSWHTPHTDHPLSLQEQNELIERIQADLQVIDSSKLKGPFHRIATGSAASEINPRRASMSSTAGHLRPPSLSDVEELTVSPRDVSLDPEVSRASSTSSAIQSSPVMATATHIKGSPPFSMFPPLHKIPTAIVTTPYTNANGGVDAGVIDGMTAASRARSLSHPPAQQAPIKQPTTSSHQRSASHPFQLPNSMMPPPPAKEDISPEFDFQMSSGEEDPSPPVPTVKNGDGPRPPPFALPQYGRRVPDNRENPYFASKAPSYRVGDSTGSTSEESSMSRPPSNSVESPGQRGRAPPPAPLSINRHRVNLSRPELRRSPSSPQDSAERSTYYEEETLEPSESPDNDADDATWTPGRKPMQHGPSTGQALHKPSQTAVGSPSHQSSSLAKRPRKQSAEYTDSEEADDDDEYISGSHANYFQQHQPKRQRINNKHAVGSQPTPRVTGVAALDEIPSHVTSSGATICDFVDPQTGKTCGVSFRRQYDLVRHKETKHTPGKRKEWICDICGGSFSRKDALQRHFNRGHAR